jgi:hypothetical protein
MWTEPNACHLLYESGSDQRDTGVPSRPEHHL